MSLYEQFESGFNRDCDPNGNTSGHEGLRNPLCAEAMKTRLAALECPSVPDNSTVTDNVQWPGQEVALTNYKGSLGNFVNGSAGAFSSANCPGLFLRNSYMNPVHFSGRSPKAEIRRVQFNQVKQLLQDTDLTLNEIAYRTGFKHSSYLADAFKREFGMPPGEYREKRRFLSNGF